MAEEGESEPASKVQGDIIQHRLWVGNIDKRLSEYNLLKILQKFGEIKYFEYLFHTSGPLKGEPRGYCFVEYDTREEALKALQGLNGKMALSRALAVHWAKEDQSKTLPEEKKTKSSEDTKPPCYGSLSLVSNDSKIQAIEAKLRRMESSSYNDDVNLTGRSKHPLLEESERNKNKPYSYRPKNKRKTDWKVLKKPR